MEEPDRAKETASRYGDKRVRLTYDDYCKLPSGLRYEIVEGDLRMVPSPSVVHQEISKRLGWMLLERAERQGLGKVYNAPCDVILSQHNVVQPDLLFVVKERLGIIRKANIQGPPDLVVEILSPSTAEWDRFTKRRAYARYGVRELWLVDLEAQTVEVTARGELDLKTISVYPVGAMARSLVLPGFEVDVAQLFENLLEE